MRDESDRDGMRLVIELKRDAIPKVVLNKLYKHTPMQTTFGVNMVALVDGVPRTLALREIIRHYVHHQREVVVRRAKHELREKEARLHKIFAVATASPKRPIYLADAQARLAIFKPIGMPPSAVCPPRISLAFQPTLQHLLVPWLSQPKNDAGTARS